MVKTRAQRKQMRSRARSYRRHRKASHCRGKGQTVCKNTAGCKVARGTKRKFCRKTRNTHTRKYRR